MNQHITIADSHSLQFEFEELEIEEGGVFFGYLFGTAELALNDARHGDFYVAHIALRGDRFIAQPSALRPDRRQRVPGYLALTPPAKDCRTFAAHLFRAIETALYASEAAAAAWAAEMEDC